MHKTGRPTIALLIPQMGDRYHSLIWPAVKKTTDSANFNLMVYVGNSLHSPIGFEQEQNIIYQAIDNNLIDGIILAGSLPNHCNAEQLTKFVENCGNIPLISIGFSIPGHPRILINNKSGMVEQLEHFITVHGYRRIAFICGPDTNTEAVERYKAYQEVLARHQIPLDHELVAPGNFVGASGLKAIKLLLEVRKVSFDALIAANDDMLLWIYHYLRQKGIKIPDEIALGGFDDIEESQNTIPPLTTVAQPIADQAAKAAELLIKHLGGEPIPQAFEMPTKLIIRQSCGCSRNYQHCLAPPPDHDLKFTEENLISFSDAILHRTCNPLYVPRELYYQVQYWTSSLLQSLHQDLIVNSTSTDFIATLNQIIHEQQLQHHDIEIFKQLLHHINEILSPVVFESPTLFTQLNALLLQAQVSLTENFVRAANIWRHDIWNATWNIRRINQELSTAFNINTIFQVIITHLSTLMIKSCYIVTYTEPFKHRGTNPAQLPEYGVLSLKYYQGQSYNTSNQPFPCKSILPEAELQNIEAEAHALMPLYFEQEHFGYIVFLLNSWDNMIFEFLRDSISAAFKGAALFGELQTTQKQLIHSEKMASLGELTAGIAHELKNPLNFINNFSEGVSDFVSELEQILRNPPLDPQLRASADAEALDLLKEISISAESIANHGKRADQIIKGMLNQARGDTGHMDDYDLNSMLHEGSNLAFHASRSQYPDFELTIEENFASNLPILNGATAALNRVFINIISNAIYAMRQKREKNHSYKALLRITTKLEKKFVLVEISDNGPGIDASSTDKIFQPFFTTKPAGHGTGLGLKICHDIIVDGHNGNISFTSAPEHGTTFSIRLPLSLNHR
jgi:DNA-binding LacI/PurR family transcriptional regulator/signal transduction histidine kinase